MGTSLRSQYMTVHSLGYSQKKLEIFVLFRTVISFKVMESCCNRSHNQHAAVGWHWLLRSYGRPWWTGGVPVRHSQFGSSGDARSPVLGQMMRQEELMSIWETSVWQCGSYLIQYLKWEEVADKADDAFFWQPLGDLGYCYRDKTSKCEQSRMFLGSAAPSVLTHAMNQWREVLCWTQSLKTRNDCRCKGSEEPCLWLDGVCDPERRETKQKVESTMQDLGRADVGLFRNLLRRLMEYSPEENDPGEIVSLQELSPPVSRVVCSNSCGKKQRGQEHWQNWAINASRHEVGAGRRSMEGLYRCCLNKPTWT